MPDHTQNPFTNDPDRRDIWEILMRRDFEGFVRQDWEHVAGDFDPSQFFVIDAGKVADSDHWSLTYPDLATYRDAWLRQAADFAKVELRGEDKLAFLYRAIRLRDIEIAGDRALARKKFLGSATTTGGADVSLRWQSLYQMQKQGGHWKITGCIGYMPHPMPATTSASGGVTAGASGGMKRLPDRHEQHAKAGPYSPALIIEPGRTVAIAGQGPLNMAGDIVGSTIEEQAEVVIRNCEQVLSDAGARLDDVYKVMVYLSDMSEWSRFNSVYARFFRKPYPVRTAIQCDLWGGMKVELDMLARVP